ncbi:penicillin-binding protein activator, partial [Candidatus Uhrbacteria bacterium]|nr:penicillin-binding protein activator [Candidatus Uhrbacteria bacterium]
MMIKSKGTVVVWVVLLALVLLGVAYWATKRNGTPEEQGTKPSETIAAQKTPIPGEKLKIGVILPLTGDAAAYGTPISRGVEMAALEINAKGGVLGKPIELIVQDGQCDGAEGNRAANKLINVDQVKFIVGGACLGEPLGFTSLAEEKKVMVISPSATNPSISDAGDFIFRTAPSDAFQARIAADFAYDRLQSRRAAILHETTDYAQGLAKVFAERFSQRGGTVVTTEQFNTGDTDFSAQVLKIKVARPDLVYLLPQAPAAGALAARQLRDNGVTARRMGAEVLAAQAVVDEHPGVFEDFVATEPFYDQEEEKAKTFLTAYAERYGGQSEFPFYTASAYSDIYLIAEAVGAKGYDT